MQSPRSKSFFTALAALCAGLLATSPGVRAAETAVLPSDSLAVLNKEFSPLATGNDLYRDYAVIQKAGWTGGSAASGVLHMTRYEMALETAKALIAVRARQRADENWKRTASPLALHSLQSLCMALSAELSRFDVDGFQAVNEIDTWLEASSSLSSATPRSDAPNLLTAEPPIPSPTGQSLSQRLRVFGAASSLDRAERDPLTGTNINDSASSLRLAGVRGNRNSSLGATFAVNDWLNLRGGLSRRSTSNSIASSLFGDSNFNASGDERALGGGLDIAVRPGVTLKGDISRFESRGSGLASFGQWNGTRFDTGVELTGWQNRVALSAQLSRLVPEDSYALASTAAQFNLGVDLSRQVSLKLLYRQLFESPQTGTPNRVIAGGFDISF